MTIEQREQVHARLQSLYYRRRTEQRGLLLHQKRIAAIDLEIEAQEALLSAFPVER